MNEEAEIGRRRFKMNEKTKVYVLFTSTGLDHRGAWDTDTQREKVLSTDQMLAELERRCEDTEFVGRVSRFDEERKDRTSRAHYGMTEEERRYGSETGTIARRRMEQAYREIEQLREDLAGVLIFGSPSERLMSMGLPIVTVFPMWGTWMTSFDFQAYGEKRVLVGFLPVVRDSSNSIFESRLDDLAKKVKVLDSIYRMRDLRALMITDRPVLGSYEYSRPDVEREEYEKAFLRNLDETLGSKVVNEPQAHLYRTLGEIDDGDAQRIADSWIQGAKGMKDIVEGEIVKSARVYLVMKKLMEINECQAVSAEGYGIFAENPGGAIPSQGLAASQFLTDGVAAPSECLLNSLVLQQLGLHLTGRPSFNGDFIIDPFNGIAIVGHCECPLNPLGGEDRSPYVIRNLPRWRKNEGGGCVQVDLPAGETVTVVQMSIYDRKMSIFTGRSVRGQDFFAEWDDLGCRTKLAIETDTESLLGNLDWETFGAHRVVFYGDYRTEFEDLATALGYELIEEDR